MHKSADFKNKEVICINSGKRLGFVSDVEINYDSGVVESIIVPSSGSLFNFFGGGANDFVIPWNNIEKVGDDIILVNYENLSSHKK